VYRNTEIFNKNHKKMNDMNDISENKKEFDINNIANAVTRLLGELGEDVTRPGLEETPVRAAKMFAEMLEGMLYSNDELAEMFGKCFEHVQSDDMVIVKDIPIFSFCEHHFALMYNMRVHIAYIPRGKVIGLSKIARIADMVGKRFQLQERIGQDIAYIMQKILETDDVMVVIEGEHSCMSARGIRAQGSKTRTNTLCGVFSTNAEFRNDVLTQLRD